MPPTGHCAIHGCTHFSRFHLILSFNADKTLVAATAKSSSPSFAMFLVRVTWMVLYATCLEFFYTCFSHISFSYKKLEQSDRSVRLTDMVDKIQLSGLAVTTGYVDIGR